MDHDTVAVVGNWVFFGIGIKFEMNVFNSKSSFDRMIHERWPFLKRRRGSSHLSFFILNLNQNKH